MDKPWHKVTINGVPTHGGGYSDDMDSDQTTAPKARYLLNKLLKYNSWLRTRKMVGEPRWISSPQTIATKDKSSIVVAFETQEDADKLVKRRGVFMFGHRATTRAYVNIPRSATAQIAGSLTILQRAAPRNRDADSALESTQQLSMNAAFVTP
ncbi:hypothetical protein K439DRAFT_1528825, partial [Ramaria rubella]